MTTLGANGLGLPSKQSGPQTNSGPLCDLRFGSDHLSRPIRSLPLNEGGGAIKYG